MFPPVFKSRAWSGGANAPPAGYRGSKARVNGPQRSGVPVQQLVDNADKLNEHRLFACARFVSHRTDRVDRWKSPDPG